MTTVNGLFYTDENSYIDIFAASHKNTSFRIHVVFRSEEYGNQLAKNKFRNSDINERVQQFLLVVGNRISRISKALLLQ